MFGFRKSGQGESPEATPQSSVDGREQCSAPEPPSLVPDELQRQARKLSLIGNEQLAGAIGAAVRAGLSQHFLFEETQLRAAVTSIGQELLQRLKASSRAVRGLPKQAFLKEVEADKRRIEKQRERARQELESLLKQLHERRLEFGKAEQELLREAERNAKAQDRDLSARIAELFSGLDASGDAASIQAQITALAVQKLQEERDKALEKQMTEHRQEVQNFERRISKLTHSLELTEDELRRIAAAKNIDIGVGSIYRTVQGLSNADVDYETKKELMTSIFMANLELQKKGSETG